MDRKLLNYYDQFIMDGNIFRLKICRRNTHTHTCDRSMNSKTIYVYNMIILLQLHHLWVVVSWCWLASLVDGSMGFWYLNLSWFFFIYFFFAFFVSFENKKIYFIPSIHPSIIGMQFHISLQDLWHSLTNYLKTNNNRK